MTKYSKPSVFILCLIPFFLISYKIFFNKLGPEPVKEITNFSFWTNIRRILGLFVFFYATLHLLTYVVIDYRFDWEQIINDVIKKKYIYIGFSAWLLLIPLAFTSSKKMMKLLKHNWKKLHRLIYVIAIFGSLHFIWLSKTILFKPLIYSLIILFLLSLRIKFKKNT